MYSQTKNQQKHTSVVQYLLVSPQKSDDILTYLGAYLSSCIEATNTC